MDDTPLTRGLLGAAYNSAPFGLGLLAQAINPLAQGLLSGPSFASRMNQTNQDYLNRAGAINSADDARRALAATQIAPNDPRSELMMALATTTRLPGWAANGPNRPFDAQNFPYTQYVEVTTPAGPLTPAQTWVDAVKGMNPGHALYRARVNWDGAQIRPLSEAEARALDPSIVGPALRQP